MWAGDYRRFRAKIVQFWSIETERQFTKGCNWRALVGFISQQSLVELLPGWRRSADRTGLHANSLLSGNLTGNFAISGLQSSISDHETAALQGLFEQFPNQIIRGNFVQEQGIPMG